MNKKQPKSSDNTGERKRETVQELSPQSFLWTQLKCNLDFELDRKRTENMRLKLKYLFMLKIKRVFNKQL